MLKAIAVLVFLVGCGVDGDDSAVRECRASAAAACEAIGYAGNATCLLSFAQDCSPQDEAAANAACCAADGLAPGSECRLTWR